jgi:hypothetical protein
MEYKIETVQMEKLVVKMEVKANCSSKRNCDEHHNRNWYSKPLGTVRPIYRTGTPLPSKHPILYTFSTNIRTEFVKHAA